MKCWAVSDAGDKWSVRLDVRDLGGHLDSTLRARAATLGYRISAAVPRFILLLSFLWTCVVGFVFHVRCICLVLKPLLSLFLVLRRLRTAFGQAAMSGSLRLANSGAVLALLDFPVGSDPGFCVVWCRFRMLRRHLAYNSSVHELARI